MNQETRRPPDYQFRSGGISASPYRNAFETDRTMLRTTRCLVANTILRNPTFARRNTRKRVAVEHGKGSSQSRGLVPSPMVAFPQQVRGPHTKCSNRDRQIA